MGGYFITPQSVESAIAEEQAKAAKNAERVEPRGNAQEDSELYEAPHGTSAEGDEQEFKTLRQEIMDLKITNRAKDMFIECLREDRKALVQEQKVTWKE